MTLDSGASESKLEQLRALSASLEAQRPILGATVDAMLAPLLEQIAVLEGRPGIATTPPQPSPSPPKREERKIVTVLMADVSGFTAMSEKMDPESVRELINACFDHLVPFVQKYGGTVEEFVGDEIVAMFGAPVAHENDPERAVRAALEMLSSLTTFNAERQTNLGIHIGVNTGLVFVGDIGTRDQRQYGITGDTINLASRLEHAASVGQVYIGHATYRQVRGLFEVEALEPLALKGKAEPVRAYCVVREKARSFRTEQRGIDGVQTRMVGRDSELAVLEELYSTACTELVPKLALIDGEAGLGKSRLLYEFLAWLEKRPDQPWLMRGRARAETSNAPFAAWREVWVDQFGLADDDPPEVTRRIFEQGIAELWESTETVAGLATAETAHVVGYLAGIDWPDSPFLAPLRLNAQEAQGRAFHLTQQLLCRIGCLRPVVLVLEDLHWTDSGTIELLTFLLEAGSELPLLIVGTARPDIFDRFPRFRETANAQTTIHLLSLNDEEVRILLLATLGDPTDFPSQVIDRIVAKVEGNPYYMEEMVKMLIERGVIVRRADGCRILPDRIVDMDLPDTLQSLLQARLDALELHEKSITQRASVVGRNFWAGAVGATKPESPVIPTLQTLALRDMVYQEDHSELAGELEFIFRHALMRDVAYESLPRRQRRIYHALVAQWLEDNLGDDTVQAAQIGLHYEMAGDKAKAVALYQKAANAASRRFANQEAVEILGRALNLSDDQADQFVLLTDRERALDWLGQRARQAEDLERMLAIAQELGSKLILSQALNREANLFARTGESRLAVDRAKQALELAREIGQHAEEAQALRNLGAVAFYNAEWPQALQFFEKSLAVTEKLNDFALKVDNLNAIGSTHVSMGNYREALLYLSQASQLAREAGDNWRRARILSNSSVLESSLGHYQAALTQKTEVLQLQREMGNRQSEAIALTNLGVEYHRLGQYSSAEEKFRECGRLFAVLKSFWGLANNLSNQALTLIEQGRLDEGLAALDEAQRTISGRGVARDLMLEIYNRRALAYLRQGHAVRAEQAVTEGQRWLEQGRVAPDNDQMALSWSYRAECELLETNAVEAVARTEQAIQIAGGHRLRADILREVLLTRARALLANQQSELARPVIEQAVRLVEESAQELDESLRESFCRDVSINRMILAL